MEATTLDVLKFPIGVFEPPKTITTAHIQTWIQEIENLPKAVFDAVNNLNINQLDTPYRPNGWTVRQVVHHMADSHINAFCRFKLALTEENPTIKPYEEALWAELPDSRLPVEVSLQLLKAMHERWTAILKNTSPADFNRTFYHPEMEVNLPLKRMLGLYAWHGKHHTAHITTLCKRMNW